MHDCYLFAECGRISSSFFMGAVQNRYLRCEEVAQKQNASDENVGKAIIEVVYISFDFGVMRRTSAQHDV